jgi:peptidyl-prolyl cis-trans isomerase B (cyclophilin B)
MKKILSLISVFILISGILTAQVKPTPKKQSAKPTAAAPKTKNTTIKKPILAPEQKVEITTNFGVIVVKLYNETPLHRDNFIKLVKEGFYDSLLFHRIINTFMIQGGDPNSKYADSTAMLGNGDVGYKVPGEFNRDLYHKKGALAAARDNNPERASSGCQFYIVHGKKFTQQELEQILNARNMNNKQSILYNCYQKDTIQAAIYQIQQSGDKELLRAYMANLQKIVDKMYADQFPDAEKVNLDQMGAYINDGGAPHLDGSYTVFGEVISGLEVVDKIANQPKGNADRPLENIRMRMRLLP